MEFLTYLKEKKQWETNNKQILMRSKRHCSPVIETKLESMLEYDGIVSAQNGLDLINLLKKIYTNQAGSKQKLAEIIDADKRLMLFWQRPGMMIDEYTTEFEA